MKTDQRWDKGLVRGAGRWAGREDERRRSTEESEI